MNRQICLLFFVSVAVLLVKSESTVEVDENGDEYDVKRFNIQGRNLNEGRSQCVEVRRKRSAPAQPRPIYNDDPQNDEMAEKDDNSEKIKETENDQSMMIYYAPPIMSAGAGNEEDEEEKDEEDNDMNEMHEDKEDGEEVTLSYMDSNNNNSTKNEEVIEEKPIFNIKEKDEKDSTIKVIKLNNLPIFGQIQSDGESVAAIASPASVEEADTEGIFVVQAHQPPKVNPQTHAIFEIVPVNDEIIKADKNEEEDEDEANNAFDGESDYDFNEELSPITTTAIWSTGDDNSYGNYDDSEIKPVKKVKKNKNPIKSNKNKKHTTALKPKRRNKYKNKQGLATETNNYNKNKKRPNKTNVKRPHKTKKTRRGYNTRRRNSNRNKQNMIRTQNKNKITRNSLSNNRYQNLNNRNRLIAKRNKNKRKTEFVDNGENTFTHTYTWTKTGDDENGAGVDCIIIRKEPEVTTQRPFWNLWGRNANGAPQDSGQFGKRKRVNIRFVA